MLRFTSLFWAYAVSWVCAAFLHSVDPDINGFQSLISPGILTSVSIVALIVLIPSALCYVAYNRGSWRAFFGSTCTLAIFLGTVMMLLGFGGNSVGSWLVGFAGSAVFFCVVLVLAALPMVLSHRTMNNASGGIK